MFILKKFFSFSTFILLNISIFAQNNNLNALMRSRNEYYFSIETNSKTDTKTIDNLVCIDKVEGNKIICYANNAQYDKLVSKGYATTLLTPPSMLEEAKMWDGSDRASYEWDSYPTYNAYEQMMNDFDEYENCTVMTLGTLNSGRKIMVARINNGEPEGKPRFIYTSTIHGDETTGWILMLRLIDYLLTSNDSRARFIVNNLDIFICPNANPDGTYHGGNNTVYGATRANGNGVDMNRNYPDFDDGPNPDGLSYQNETQWFMNLAQEYLFTMGANYHGGAEVVNYPWDTYQPHHVDNEWWKLVSKEYADKCQEVSSNYMVDLNDGITNGYAWYTITGSRQDYMNYYAECRELTIECSTTKLPSANNLPHFWDCNFDAMLSFLEQALYGIHGIVTDSITGQPLQGVKVKVIDHDEDYAKVTSHEAGDYHRVIKAGTYSLLFTKDGYCPTIKTVSVQDGLATNLDVKLIPGDCLLADFSADKTIIATGETVYFTDMSIGGNISNHYWQFEGGTPAASTTANPSVRYNTPGVYPVTLTISSSSESDQITKTEYITVAESEFNMSSTTIHACNTLFYDNNGPDKDYSSNVNMTTIIYPEDENATLQVIFAEFATEESYDILYIYDGAGANNNSLIGTYSGADSPGTVTASTPGGALTFVFISDPYMEEKGWTALLKCIVETPAEPLTATVTANPESIIEHQSSQLTATAAGGSGTYTYTWVPAETLDNPASATPIATPTETTTYTVTVNDGKEIATAQVTVTVTPDGTIETSNSFKIYPNPANNEVKIETTDITEKTTYRLYNSLGQECGNGIIEGSININTSTLENGVYFIEISSTNKTTTSKIIVR